MAKLQSPRGTSDLLPQDMAGHRHVINTAKTISLSFGFEEMQPRSLSSLRYLPVRWGKQVMWSQRKPIPLPIGAVRP